MKNIPAIVEAAPIDIELLAEQVIVALTDERSIDSQIKNLEGRLEDARGARHMRRMEIGRLLAKARKQWPERGPNAKGWSQFLAHVRLDDSTAWRYIDEATNPRVFSQTGSANDAEDNGNPESRANLRENSDSQESEPANVFGGSKDPARGEYCTPKKWAHAVGPWDLDPFSNVHSHITAVDRLSLEAQDDGLLDLAQPGSFYRAPRTPAEQEVAQANPTAFMSLATELTRTFIQPPYELVDEAIGHYGHTRFCALLRFDTSTAWFKRLWALTAVVCFPLERLNFEPPPGIESSANPFPHAFFYACGDDVTDEMRALCIVVRVDEAAALPEARPNRPEGGDVSLDEPA